MEVDGETVQHEGSRYVGISAIQMYFPKRFVSQSDLEKFDGVSAGKYTVGLGQQEMAVVSDNEDIVSVSLTVTEGILRDYRIPKEKVGFLAVGTETMIDKSKSVKSELMKLFPAALHDIEGVDVKNACFGGTQAFFHAVDWVRANADTDGRGAMVVMADIAVYEAGPARPTGGVGAIALFIEPNAPIVVEHGLRVAYMDSKWDFYKPLGPETSEYPMVDGPESLSSYMKSVDECYNEYRSRSARLTGVNESLQQFSAVMFHCPFAKMVQKALARLAYRDSAQGVTPVDGYSKLIGVDLDDRLVSQKLLELAKPIFEEKTNPNLTLNRRIGNMYTPSLFAQLITFLSRRRTSEERLLLFAYGSGSASAMFSLNTRPKNEKFERITTICGETIARLERRKKVTPEEYTNCMDIRMEMMKSDVPYKPSAPSTGEFMFPGTFFLEEISEKYHRTYGLTQVTSMINGFHPDDTPSSLISLHRPSSSENSPKNVGISAIQMYFPAHYVCQAELEKHDEASTGKYTKGLGQHQMSFCGENEDVVSLALTVTDALLKDYQIDPKSVGFLAVGTETIIDKSKSVKTELMKLFSDNHSIEGVDIKHACYGGTQALFHAVDWVQANHSVDGRNAIVVMTDIAVYEKGPARPSGGAGAVALLISPDAPLVIDKGLRSTHMQATWDFYKPIRKLNTEYPMVDGQESLKCYLRCLVNCYDGYRRRSAQLRKEEASLSLFDGVFLHCPFARLVEKGIATLAFEDAHVGKYSHPIYESLRPEATVLDRQELGPLCTAASSLWDAKTSAFLNLNRRIGNMYTPSMIAQLVQFLSKRNYNSRRLLLFAYGSGAASAMFSLTVQESSDELKRMEDVCAKIVSRLDERTMSTPLEYEDFLNGREELCKGVVPFEPRSLPVFPGTFILTNIDQCYRRSYRKTVPNDIS